MAYSEELKTVIMLFLVCCCITTRVKCRTTSVEVELLVDDSDPEDEEGDLDPSDLDLPILLWWDMQGSYVDHVTDCSSGNRCAVTNNISLFHRQKPMMYMFYGSTFLDSGLPLPRRDGDLWALIHEESPKNNDWIFSFESTLELFNYTSTFKRDSDLPMPTLWLANEDALTTSAYTVPTAVKNKYRKEGLAPIVFVHSDCSTPSNREQYLGLLQQHVDVDSYGSCMRNKQFPKEFSHLNGNGQFSSPAFLKFIARYKFALSFENAICDDYITEKFWRPLQVGVVPIAMGSPKLKDFVPGNKSVILIQDFETVRDLAKFIKELDANDDQYETYLEFKHSGVSNSMLLSEINRLSPEGASQHYGTFTRLFNCFACDKLYEARSAVDRDEPIPKSQADLKHFGCPLPTQKFDDNGRYVSDPSRDREIRFYQNNAQLFRYLYDKSENITSRELYHHSLKLETEEVRVD